MATIMMIALPLLVTTEAVQIKRLCDGCSVLTCLDLIKHISDDTLGGYSIMTNDHGPSIEHICGLWTGIGCQDLLKMMNHPFPL